MQAERFFIQARKPKHAELSWLPFDLCVQNERPGSIVLLDIGHDPQGPRQLPPGSWAQC